MGHCSSRCEAATVVSTLALCVIARNGMTWPSIFVFPASKRAGQDFCSTQRLLVWTLAATTYRSMWCLGIVWPDSILTVKFSFCESSCDL